MSNTSLSPWNLSYNDPQFISPNGKYEVEFRNIGEIAMSAPHGADACILLEGGKRVELDEWCGGPLVWENGSSRFAIPIWTKGRRQRMGVVDMDSHTLTIFSEPFRVLHLERFENGVIHGVDSPIYRTKKLAFVVADAEIERMKTL